MVRTASTEHSDHLLHGVVVKHKARSLRAGGSHILMEFDLPAGCDTAAVVDEIVKRIGDRHQSGTVTCFVDGGKPVVSSWDADDKKVRSVPFPDVNIKVSACFVAGTGHVLVALTSGPADESLVQDFLSKCGTQGDVADKFQRMGLDHTGMPPSSVLKPNMSRASIPAFKTKGLTACLRARVDGILQLQYLRLRPCTRIREGGGFIMAIDGGFPGEPANVQLQLVCDDVIVDRYDLSADHVRAMQREVAGTPP